MVYAQCASHNSRQEHTAGGGTIVTIGQDSRALCIGLNCTCGGLRTCKYTNQLNQPLYGNDKGTVWYNGWDPIKYDGILFDDFEGEGGLRRHLRLTGGYSTKEVSKGMGA